MTDKGSITKLTCLINGISMAGPHETIPLESCEHIARAIHTSGWLEQVKAEAWDEGKRSGMRQSDWEHGDTPTMHVAVNPYRKEQAEMNSDLAVAWDEGAETAWNRSTPEVNGARYHWRHEGEPTNPYRKETDA